MSDRYLYKGKEVKVNWGGKYLPFDDDIYLTCVNTGEVTVINYKEAVKLYRLPPKYVNTPLWRKLEGE